MKTISLKKVSAIAVASLGFGLLSVVPAQAAELGTGGTGGTVTAITASTVTTSPKVGTAVFVKFGATLAALTASAANSADVITFAASLTSVPSGGSVGISSVVAGSATPAGTATAVTASAGTTPTLAGNASLPTFTATLATENTTAWSAQTLGYLGAFRFTPTKDGSHTMTIWSDYDNDGTLDGTEVYQTVAITVAAAAGYSNTLSTSVVTASSTSAQTGPLVTGKDDEVRVSKAVTTDAGTIKVTVLNTSGAAFGSTTVEASVTSGPGLVTVDTTDDTTTNGTYRSHSVDLTSAQNVAYVHVNADGNAGTGVVTIKIYDTATGALLGTLATETFYFFGTVSKLTATAIGSVARAGTAIGCTNASTCAQDTFANTPFVVVKAEDSTGQLVPALSLSAKITDANVIGSSTINAVDMSGRATVSTAGVTTDVNGLGYYNASVTGATSAASGAKTTVSYRIQLADLTYVTSNEVTISVGGTAAKETVSFDKTTYAPGEAMVVTRTATDSAGNPAYDGQTAASVTFSKSVGGSVGASVYVGGKKATSATAPTVFAPALGGSFTALLTSATTAATSTATASVTDANAGLLTQIDALNAKIVALNALIAKIMKKLGVK